MEKIEERFIPICQRCGFNAINKGGTVCKECARGEKIEGLGDLWINETIENWRHHCQLIPPIVVPEGYFIKIAMPYGGVAARFLMGKVSDVGRVCSVYFDPFNRLGSFDNPYWEIYPNENGDTERFSVGQEVEMMECIVAALNSNSDLLSIKDA